MWAFSDESERGATMLFGTLLVPAAAIAPARKQLRGLLLPGQRRVHTAKESRTRRRQLIEITASLGATAVVFDLRRQPGVSRIDARRTLVDRSTTLVLNRSVTRWTLDDQDPAQASRDRHTIDTVMIAGPQRLVYDHSPGHQEPLLWATDAIVWAIGAGGDWARRVEKFTSVERL